MIRDSSKSPLLSDKKRFFKPAAYARDGSTPLPQIVAHRGYKKLYPENSLAAFKGALEAGSHGIETDLQLSQDGVVIVAHDPSLKRCFGVDKLIADCTWEYLSTLRTKQEPHEKLLRLSDLLEFFNSPSAEHAWALLDIKRNNDPRTMIRKIAETIKIVSPSSRPWSERIVLGCWGPTYFPLCDEYLPDFPTALICASVFSARRVLKTEQSDISFNTLIKALQGPALGYNLIDSAHTANRLVFAWTINKPKDMRWAIRHGVDAVLTDDPAQFRQICDVWDAAEERRTRKEDRFTIAEHVQLVTIAVLVALFGWTLKYQFPRTRRLQKRQRLAADENPAHLIRGTSGL
ncbi:glycerophosphoryl diester phosphodiesterase [Talaromyces islandicus]|uniref:Glycerophosphoryl diester phosphodiesterase n=1 Tax=Talaromyces islandicus TaxID=28573 RepID=A0A0U1LTX0_TALIS|nr:glycerophosphoryl diester phosphodiesterase [Talaromyces islandicus]